MVVLALETVTRAGSVALVDGDTCVARAGDASRTHGVRLPGEILDLLAAQGRSVRDIDLFAVVIGPGSFTGLRVGVAAIQGLALVGGKRVVAVPTLEAMVEAWTTRHPEAGVVVACLDGHRSDVFWGTGSGRDCRLVDDVDKVDSRDLTPIALGTDDDVVREVLAVQHDGPVVLVGDAAERIVARLAGRADAVAGRLEVTLAEVAARRAARHPDRALAPHALRPLYIRLPDAVIARDKTRAAEPVPEFPIALAAAQDDLTAVAALQRRAFVDAWGVDSIQWELQNNDVARLYVMRAPDGGVAAYCACWMIADELHINSLAVDEAWRRRGLARRLLRHVFRESVTVGATSATLEVRQSNTAGRTLYEGLGFSVEGVRRDYYQHPREDALVLWLRNLGPLW